MKGKRKVYHAEDDLDDSRKEQSQINSEVTTCAIDDNFHTQELNFQNATPSSQVFPFSSPYCSTQSLGRLQLDQFTPTVVDHVSKFSCTMEESLSDLYKIQLEKQSICTTVNENENFASPSCPKVDRMRRRKHTLTNLQNCFPSTQTSCSDTKQAVVQVRSARFWGSDIICTRDNWTSKTSMPRIENAASRTPCNVQGHETEADNTKSSLRGRSHTSRQHTYANVQKRHSRRSSLLDIPNIAMNLENRFLPPPIQNAMFVGNENKAVKENLPTGIKRMSRVENRGRPCSVNGHGTSSFPSIRNPATHPPQADHYQDITFDFDIMPSDDYELGDSAMKVHDDEGDAIYACKFCGANFWYEERVKGGTNKVTVDMSSLCCLKGKVLLPPLQEPPELLKKLFFDKKCVESKNFHQNIRQYNNMFSFTSMGGKIDHAKNRGAGPYTFVLAGMNYHNIGSLLPHEGRSPAFSQLYIYDTENEVTNRIAAVSKHQDVSSIDPNIVHQLKDMLDQINPFVQQYRRAKDVLNTSLSNSIKLCILGTRQTDGRTYNVPTGDEVAALIVGDIDMNLNVRDIIVQPHDGHLQRINELSASYLPLQYPLLFPFGEDGYRDDVPHRDENLDISRTRKRVSLREFFSYRLMVRDCELSTFIHASRLYQQFIVEGYTMIESQRLLWVRTHQKELRADLYQGLSDTVLSGETNASTTGKRIVLPASFTGSARYMLYNYQDVMAICRAMGYPDLFITFTCNPAWPEITRHCKKYDLKPSDCPTILSRVFNMKLKALMKTIKKKRIFGKVTADIYTIEFQKRGLPHAHILLFLERQDKLKDTDMIDKAISAEIPDEDSDPKLYELVKKFMMHGPCGTNRPNGPCMKDKRCTKYYPVKWADVTTVDDNGYPTYRRRDDGRVVHLQGIALDNRYVVPHSPTLLHMFQAHINVEKCNQSTAIKYMFKYISKGNDRAVLGLFDSGSDGSGPTMFDEILQYYNCRYISACEACWRIFGFLIHCRNPSVERLSFHLPNQQYVIYSSKADVSDLIDNPRVCESQFLSWFKMNKLSSLSASLTYSEFPHHFVYQKGKRQWKEREKGFAVGRICHVSPSAGELYYLRILLTQVRGPTCFDDIKTVDGVIYETFRDACFALGLLDDDKEYIRAIHEASVWESGKTLRKFFVTMLLCGSVKRPEHVWEQTAQLLCDDLMYIPHADHVNRGIHISDKDKQNVGLNEIEEMLRRNGKTILDFPNLPEPDDSPHLDLGNPLILQEFNHDRKALKVESARLLASLNDYQSSVYHKVIESVGRAVGDFYFVHGYGGTGKTFLWNAIASKIRSDGHIVLAVASSGIAATLLPSGRTAHSRFAIPIDVDESTVCSIRQHSPLAELIEATKLIIWDEAPMVQRYCIEAFDRTLQDIMGSAQPFGGKCVLMGGDFRQILPVIPQGGRASVVNACINSSFLWEHCKVFHLKQNMRLQSCSSEESKRKLEWFSQWLLDIGDGKLGTSIDGTADVEIPTDLVIGGAGDPINAIANATYPDLMANLSNNEYFNSRAILAPTLEIVEQINTHMVGLLPGIPHEFLSCDTVCKSTVDSDCFEDLYTTEFLNSITCSGLPPHKLVLKVGSPIMLIRNIDQAEGLCNGTRLRILRLGKNVIEAVVLNGYRENQKVLLQRMDLNPSESRWPFKIQRRQFPITLSFAITINKSQGQSLHNVGLYLSKPVFTHGQLYVAMSRVRSVDGLKIVISESESVQSGTTKNVVYQEVFRNLYSDKAMCFGR